MPPISKKHFIIGFISGTVILFAFFASFSDRNLHVVFCNVGQGDAIYIRTANNMDLLIDGGNNNQVLGCLGAHMPFYDRTLDMVILTHPESDHFRGLIEIVRRFNIKNIVLNAVKSESNDYQLLLNEINNKKIMVRNLYQGDSFSLGKTKLDVLWPEKNWLLANIEQSFNVAMLDDTSILGLSTKKNLNDFSLNLHLQYGQFDLLLTGDADTQIQPTIMRLVNLPEVEVLKFPHHGSKYGVSEGYLDKVSPDLAVISVGKNPWGHPTTEALSLLKKKGIRILRTDEEGDIEIISDGKGWEFKK